MKNIQSQSTSNPPSISQKAAVAALNGDQSCIGTMVKAFKERHDFVVNGLNAIDGIRCIPANGAFYAFFYVQPIIDRLEGINNDLELAEFLLNKAEIALVPGSAFGAPGYLRLSFATSMENLKKALERLKKAVK
jgi:aspartate aminotransferase